MAYRPEDLQLDEGYWRALLAEVEQLPVAATRPPHRPSPSAHSPGSYNHAPPLSREGSRDRAAIDAPSTHVPEAEESLWEALRAALANNDLLDVEATGCNRGGLIVVYHTLRGFVPSSHLHTISPDMDEPTRRTALAAHIGQTLHVRVIELEPDQGRIVFSERTSAADEDQPHELPSILHEIHAGETRHGHVTNLTAFGAFVDLGGYEGLVHVSELSWSRINHPRDLLRIGDEVSVFVMNVIPEEGRIALSLKRAKANPWEHIEDRYHVGQVVHGTVTNVVQFGAFVKVEDDLEGLVHVSELAEGSFMHPRNIVREGEHVTARVIGVDSQHRRLALSLRGVPNGHAADPAPPAS
jgi:small subunit ribosomal protein S1